MAEQVTQAKQNSRRKALKALGAAVVTAPLIGLATYSSDSLARGCGRGGKGGFGGRNRPEMDSLPDDTTDIVDDTVPDSDVDLDDSTDDSNNDTTSGSWASGTTDLITVAYPDDSLFAAASVCSLALTGQTTEGPCYFSVDGLEDISAGLSGLPMMLCLQVIDSTCNPVEGAVVEIWHCDTAGVYSADTSESDDSSRFAGNFCTGGNEEANNSKWFRGELTTDSNGRVNFKTQFPGWYSGRTIHVHFRVRQGSYDSVISQFCFEDAFCEEICTSHDQYSNRGSQDTPLSSGRDTVFGANYANYLLNTQQNTDGTLLAYKKIQIS